ncbi:MAG: LemA family protein [Alphaproteobacteria bacterium]|nr:LemA family protein [Alphaproteobacteria bacterium]
MDGFPTSYALVAVAVILVGWGILIYNRLVALRQRVREGWSGIDVQLKRRASLIPNLVETVKGYAGHERGVLEAVTESRARAQAATESGPSARQAAEGELSTALVRLFAVAENYPALAADESFLELQRTLAELESQIQMARRYYNGTVRDLNTLIESFPSNVVAGWFRFLPADYYEVEHAGDRILPAVSF